MAMDNPTPTLEESFSFTKQDLEFNRVGHLSESQIAALRGGARRLATAIIASLLALGLITIWTIGIESDELPLFLLAIGIPAAVILWFTIGTAESALGSRAVVKVTGTAYVAYGMLPFTPLLADAESRKGRMITRMAGTYVLRVSDQEFRLTREQYQAIQPGILVAAYYLPTIHKVVSIEVLANAYHSPEPTDELPAPVAPPVYSPEPDGDTLRA